MNRSCSCPWLVCLFAAAMSILGCKKQPESQPVAFPGGNATSPASGPATSTAPTTTLPPDPLDFAAVRETYIEGTRFVLGTGRHKDIQKGMKLIRDSATAGD